MRLPRTVAEKAAASAGRRSSPNRMRPAPFWVPGAVVLLIVALGLTLGLRALASDSSTTSSSLPSLLQAAGPLVVFSEFGEAADSLWAANPDDPTDRIELGRVDHARWYGISPSLSPKGALVAYTVLPPDLSRPDRDAPAELWVLETAGGEARRLADGVDLLITPVWSPAGDAVVVRRSEWSEGDGGGVRLLRIDLTGAPVPVVTAEAELFPIDFSPDGAWLYYAVVSSSGTDLARAPAFGGGKTELVAHLSDGLARDWQLSPDGRRLAYLAQAPADASVAFVAQVLDLSTGGVQTPLAGAMAAQFSPVWEREGGLTIGRLDGSGAGGAPVRLSAEGGGVAASALPPPSASEGGGGFDVPLSWSPDGVHLAVRSFEGVSVTDPGPSRVVVVNTGGSRRELSPLSDVAVAGWLEAPE